MPAYRRWERLPADGFDESSGDHEDPGSPPERHHPAREVVLEWWGGVLTARPSEESWWDWTPFETLLTPDGARQRRVR